MTKLRKQLMAALGLIISCVVVGATCWANTTRSCPDPITYGGVSCDNTSGSLPWVMTATEGSQTYADDGIKHCQYLCEGGTTPTLYTGAYASGAPCGP